MKVTRVNRYLAISSSQVSFEQKTILTKFTQFLCLHSYDDFVKSIHQLNFPLENSNPKCFSFLKVHSFQQNWLLVKEPMIVLWDFSWPLMIFLKISYDNLRYSLRYPRLSCRDRVSMMRHAAITPDFRRS